MSRYSLSRCISRYRSGYGKLYKIGSVIVLIIFLCLNNLYFHKKWSSYKRNSTYNNLDVQQRRIQMENTDEFILPVLQKYKCMEVDLIAKSKEAYDFYDEEIQNDLAKIKPELGQGGEKSSVPESKIPLAQKIQEVDGFNRLLSDMISPNRSIRDVREEGCRKLIYADTNLPDATIVIIFLEEAYSALVRAVHSIFNRTPSHLLREIILVDDYSSKNNLKGKLERYLATRFPVGKVRLIRVLRTSGLIRARMIGAHYAKGDVIAFLDSHIEVGEAWLEPMLQRIKEDRKAVVCPNMDIIDRDTMEYYGTQSYHAGGFSWDGNFVWISNPEIVAKRKALDYSPIQSPTMTGGAFAIDRKYFWEIGSYDPEMLLWGGENLELAFRVWQCGGSVEIIPCSRLGHIYKKQHPYNKPEDEDSFGFNTARLAEVWMDEYKELFYYFKPEMKNKTFGNITGRLNFRRRLKCKSFKWYLDNIYKGKFMLWADSAYYGQIKNLNTNHCLDTMQTEHFKEHTLSVYPCHAILYPSQMYYLARPKFYNPDAPSPVNSSLSLQLRSEFMCAMSSPDTDDVQMVVCENVHDTWRFKDELIIHENSEKCLTVTVENTIHSLKLKNCTLSSNQKWTINSYGIK